jgi:hypothetical protein
MSIEHTFVRIAEALEGILAHVSGADAPRTNPAETGKAEATTTKEPTAAEKKAAKKAADDAKAAAKAEAEAAAAAAKAEEDEGDPLGGSTPTKREYDEASVRDILSKLIDKDGKAAALEVLKDKGKGAKNFTELKKENFEDVYVECEERLA